MKLICLMTLCALALCACSKNTGVRLTHDAPVEINTVAKDSAPKLTAKTEPVFFNGKVYQVSFVPLGAGKASVKISGMSAGQAKAAAELGKSSFHHFSCREKQPAILSTPVYDNGLWLAEGRCV